MLALVHHAIVQFAAYQTGYQGWFDAYAVLGDDVVIANSAVARRYLAIMKRLGVGVGLAKSLKGRGSCEFARRLVIKGLWVTPISLREFSLVRSFVPALVELVRRISTHSTLRMSSIARAAGFGYKAVSRLSQPVHLLKGRIQGLVVALIAPVATPFSASSWTAFFALAGKVGSLEARFQAVWDGVEPRVRELLRLATLRGEQLESLRQNIRSFCLYDPQTGPTFVVGLGDATPFGDIHADWDPIALWADWWISPIIAKAVYECTEAVVSIHKLGPSLGHKPENLLALETLLKALETADNALSMISDLKDLRSLAPPRERHDFSRLLHLFRRIVRILR
jgi:hypothetical protein